MSQKQFNKRANIVAGLVVLAGLFYVGFVEPYQRHGFQHIIEAFQ